MLFIIVTSSGFLDNNKTLITIAVLSILKKLHNHSTIILSHLRKTTKRQKYNEHPAKLKLYTI